MFLALGMLSWQDPADPEEKRRAPVLLVPVELNRESAAAGFRLKYSGEDVSPNICLLEFLRQQFDVKPETPTEDEEFSPGRYFDRFAAAISGQAGWSIDRTSIELGFFSFAKFLMYRDLDPQTWPNQQALFQNPTLLRLLGNDSFAGDTSPYSDAEFLDDHANRWEQMNVVDADSTQTLALLDAAAGKSMIIQGPPGTGKSQTIVNLIAQALSKNQKVLFVSEKKTALEVVRSRLGKAGLGNPCLELHSNKAKKKEVIDELKRTLAARPATSPPRPGDKANLIESREKLNDYCRAVNLDVGQSGLSAIQVYGLMLPVLERLQGMAKPIVEMTRCLEWDQVATDQKRNAVRAMQERLTDVGVPADNPFWGSDIGVVLPATLEQLSDQLRLVGQTTDALISRASELANCLPSNSVAAESVADIAGQIRIARIVVDSPNLDGLDLLDDAWTARSGEIQEAISVGQRLDSLRLHWSASIKPEAWTADVSLLRSKLNEYSNKWWRQFSPEWRALRKQARALLMETESTSHAQLVAALDAISESHSCREHLDSHSEAMSGIFKHFWQGESSAWSELLGRSGWIAEARRGLGRGELPNWFLRFVADSPNRERLLVEILKLEGSIEEFAKARLVVLDRLRFPAGHPGIPSTTAEDKPLKGVKETWALLERSVPSIAPLSHYLRARAEAARLGETGIAGIADRWPPASEHLLDLFDYFRLSSLLEHAFSQSPALAAFDARSHTTLVSLFRSLDSQSLTWAQQSIAEAHANSIPANGPADGQLGYLYRIFERQSRFPPIRQLVLKSGRAIQAIKPVFMMSPLSVANFLPPEAVDFDLVIFDEASQVRPADALGSIVRGRQAIVVGDSQQLPPTSFFDSLAAADSDEDENNVAADIESVLGLFRSRQAHERMLRWHYRSRHESLIAVSNHLFYDDKLVVFPSPDQSRADVGLVYRKVPNAPYDRSRTRTNPGEAKAVAEAVMKHAAAQLAFPPRGRLTLGVAAFSVAQRDAILDQLEILRRSQPRCEEFFADGGYEPFFVRNLENVQGDERDVIFISVGYGRTAEGYLAMNFGPVNRDGGERRLNVLFTRARRRCELFTTLSANDIELNAESRSGLQALKTFLQYAESGKLDIPETTGRPADSVFEEQVADSLRRLGYKIETQIGSAGFSIDLAVVDPKIPGGYLLGIECDGARYHSSRSARDRDRLRQAVLEGLGWRIHRVWSTAWFRDRDNQLEQLVAAIKLARKEPVVAESPKPREPMAEPIPPPPAEPSFEVGTGPKQTVSKYRFCEMAIGALPTGLYAVPTYQLVEWLAEVVSVEAPVHWLEAARRIADAVGIQRVGNRIQEAIREACRAGSRAKRFVYRNEFLLSLDCSNIPIRDRSEFPPQIKKLDYVAPQELQAAIRHVVATGYGIDPKDLPHAACRLLGFARVSEEMRSIVEKHTNSLVSAGDIERRGSTLVVTSRPSSNGQA